MSNKKFKGPHCWSEFPELAVYALRLLHRRSPWLHLHVLDPVQVPYQFEPVVAVQKVVRADARQVVELAQPCRSEALLDDRQDVRRGDVSWRRSLRRQNIVRLRHEILASLLKSGLLRRRTG